MWRDLWEPLLLRWSEPIDIKSKTSFEASKLIILSPTHASASSYSIDIHMYIMVCICIAFEILRRSEYRVFALADYPIHDCVLDNTCYPVDRTVQPGEMARI